MPTYLYHWTHKSNLPSIAASGLDPSYARGKLRCVWMCDQSRVMWAVGHVAEHHEVSPDEMVLLRIRVDSLELHRTSWPAVRVSRQRIPPYRIVGVRAPLGSRWESIRRWKA